MIKCVSCGSEMKNVLTELHGHQPLGGLAFYSYGHYGTTVFDPMDNSYIEISVCDGCLREAIERNDVFFSRPSERDSILSQPQEEKVK